MLSTSTGAFERDGRELKEEGTPEDRINVYRHALYTNYVIGGICVLLVPQLIC